MQAAVDLPYATRRPRLPSTRWRLVAPPLALALAFALPLGLFHVGLLVQGIELDSSDFGALESFRPMIIATQWSLPAALLPLVAIGLYSFGFACFGASRGEWKTVAWALLIVFLCVGTGWLCVVTVREVSASSFWL